MSRSIRELSPFGSRYRIQLARKGALGSRSPAQRKKDNSKQYILAFTFRIMREPMFTINEPLQQLYAPTMKECSEMEGEDRIEGICKKIRAFLKILHIEIRYLENMGEKEYVVGQEGEESHLFSK